MVKNFKEFSNSEIEGAWGFFELHDFIYVLQIDQQTTKNSDLVKKIFK